jgi:hypothetical protein
MYWKTKHIAQGVTSVAHEVETVAQYTKSVARVAHGATSIAERINTSVATEMKLIKQGPI